MWFAIAFIAVVVVVGAVSALVWWRIADRVFPGADAKSGYRKSRRAERPSGPPPTVISRFESAGKSE